MKIARLITGLATALALGGTGAALADRHNGGTQMRPTFDALDTDGDGEITRAEMTAHMQSRFDRADADGDGALSREELITRMMARQAERIGRRADHMIDRHDADGDGHLGMQELQARRRGGMMARMDLDGDGTVSRAEFDDWHSQQGDRHHGMRGRKSGE